MRALVLPDSQRRSLDDLAQDLDLSSGDTRSKRSAFWTMLTLSSVIAVGGVLTDSTATVIGAMIIAPLSTPIMGIALASVQRRRIGAVAVVLSACTLVIAVGLIFSLVLPSDYDLLANSQISSRTSPGLMDLVAALATGFAGAVALARRDVAAVLPGVAIAISLVPPLVVVGVCLGRLSGVLALGALVLFVSNLFALVFGGMVVFAALAYRASTGRVAGRPARRAYAGMALLFIVVFVPLAANTTLTFLINTWTSRAKTAAEEWLADSPGAEVTSVDAKSQTLYINVRVPGELPPVQTLLDDLQGQIPNGIPVVVDATRGRRVEAGTVGG
ncbi:TIGR00341 family protein [Streptomyces sp. MUM 136J]|uniref:TIGR00341 family protein n=1 Tax=Streptomyces sp. MUM 136J TaxID=2791992 RepID=UPI001F0479F1|nr:TIGR00341 family protein [Streptomyces sp. MUM 136J]